jgi:PilZ domain
MANAIQRNENRINLRIPVLFGQGEPGQPGYVKNLSEHGAAITCSDFVTPKTLINLRLETTAGPLDMMGEVRWSRRFALHFSFIDDCEMGVQFLDVDPEYPAFFASMEERFKELRAEPRFDKTFLVNIDDDEDLQTLNISRSGIFVATANPPAKGSVVQLRLHLAALNETFNIEGEIVHSLNMQEAAERSMDPGFGLKFQKFLNENAQVFHEYIDWLTAARDGN